MTDFRVAGYATPNYSLKIDVPVGSKLLETLHTSESSAAIEIEAWQRRMLKGEVSKAELIDLRPGGRLTNLNVQAHTKIGWSWES